MLAGSGIGAVEAAETDQKVAQLVATITESLAGETGFAARLLDGDAVIALNGDAPFPMASAYKVPIAGKVLSLVDQGEVSLDQMVEIPAESYVPSPVIAANFIHPGVALSVANLLEVMIVSSDNTATDALIKLAGGPEAVTRWLRDIGIEGMSVDRYTSGFLKDAYHLDAGLPGILAPDFGSDIDPNDPAIPAFEADPRDHATPAAMLDLLVKIDSGGVLKPESRDLLLTTMSRTVTGPDRIKGLLPPGTPVAHKTGTIGGVANDVGFITLPDGRRFAIAIFTRRSTTPRADRDRAVAETARIVYDFYATQ